MERRHTGASSYVGTVPAAEGTGNKMANRYVFAFNGAPAAQTFVLQATPAGAQANDACGVLGINQIGQKSASGGTVADCWRR